MSCYTHPGEPTSQLWSTRKMVWIALAFLAAFVSIFSSGSIFEDATAKPGHLMFATIVAMALVGIPMVHREWAFGRRGLTVLITITWLVATVTFVRSFAPLTSMESMSVGLPRGLLVAVALGSAVMGVRAGKAKWPEVSWDASDKQWVAQLRALLNRYYSWPATAADEAVLAALDQAKEAGMSPLEALGQPWEVAAEFATQNPDNARFSIRFPVWAGLGFIVLSIGSIGLHGLSAAGIMFAVIGLLLLGFSWWVTKQL